MDNKYGYIIVRPIGGISLNTFQFVSDGVERAIGFSSIRTAKKFLADKGMTKEEFEAQGIRFVKVALRWTIVGEEGGKDE